MVHIGKLEVSKKKEFDVNVCEKVSCDEVQGKEKEEVQEEKEG